MKAENPLFVSSPFLAAPSLPSKVGALALPLLFALAACGGGAASAPPPETPTAAAEPAAVTNTAPAASPAAASDTEESKAKSLGNASTPSSTSGPTTSPAAPAKIEFPAHATVDQAIKAIPQGQPRMNMADDALRAPLLDLKRYDKCKVPRSTHVTMSVAVYEGAAVGADISSKPKNAKIEECVDEVVRSMTWPKVTSLNTVTASF